MAPKKSVKNDAKKLHKEWYFVCTDKCGGKEQRVLLALLVGGKGKQKRAMCAGCREFLPVGTKTYKR